MEMAPKRVNFDDVKSGTNTLRPLYYKGQNKNEQPTKFKDVDYIYLLGKRCLEMDENNPNKKLPISNYGEGFDIDTCNVAKKLAKAIDDGEISRDEASEYIKGIVIMED